MRVANVGEKNCTDGLEVPCALLDATAGRIAEIKSLTSESVQGERQTSCGGTQRNKQEAHALVGD